jgi:hypothetical protein
LLAVAVYFILLHWDPTKGVPYILAVVSFGIGLVTDEIIQLIIKVVRSVVGSIEVQKTYPKENGGIQKPKDVSTSA